MAQHEYGLVGRLPEQTLESMERDIRAAIEANGHTLVRVEFPDLTHIGISRAVWALAED